MKAGWVSPIVRLWWKKRERETDHDRRLAERHEQSHRDIAEKSIEQFYNETYNRKGLTKKRTK